MAELVLLREVDPNTFLHVGQRGQSTCLRDFSRDPNSPPVENRSFTKTQLEEMLLKPGNVRLDGPRLSTDDHAAWHRIVVEQNDWYGLPGNEGPGHYRRLLDRFQAEIGPMISASDDRALGLAIAGWAEKLSSIVEKVGYNHWDSDDSTGLFPLSKGLGWTSAMLEFCRKDGDLGFIQAGSPSLDFALIAMELNLSLSSTRNPFQPGLSDFIKPDGLGVRRDGSFCVVEVKAVNDCPELFRATIQALCGAVAVYAKRRMIIDLASRCCGRRPIVVNPVMPDTQPSLGLYVMIDTSNFLSPGDACFDASLLTILSAFPPLREIAFFRADTTLAGFPAVLPVFHVVTRP